MGLLLSSVQSRNIACPEHKQVWYKFFIWHFYLEKKVIIYSPTHQRRKSLPQILRSQTDVLDLDG